MAVFFSHHAKKRCKQEKINPYWVTKEIDNIPPIRGKWMTRYGAVVLDLKPSGDILVITVISKRKYAKTRNIKVRRNTLVAALTQ